ncbi:MAG: hypothetical protein NT019_02900 [Candidatus Adlerbacteria bacterium]|nr:hypothetical protein [Candidatus Adlerbacteria bacterium]
MTCLNAVAPTATASPRIPVPVLKRELLHEGSSVVQIHVPLEARRSTVEDAGRTIHFLQFKHNVHGGILNFFVHGETAEELERYYGDMVVARAKVWQKDMEDGRKFVYVDLLPTSMHIAATHAIFVLYGFGEKAKSQIPYAEADWTTFKTPGHLKGAVVLVPLTAMRIDMPALLQAEPAEQKALPAPTTPARQSTGDGQLDRLLAAGWSIASETDNVVNLAKGEKTMQHRKPKKKR